MVKLLIGGSPCTHWSIAQKNNRETEPKGLGWELFVNYLLAKEKFKPDFFLYENNKSAAQPIKDEIKKQLGVWDNTVLSTDSRARYIEINSALVSAQNRQRFYVHNCGEVEQPADRGILLRDILENWTGEQGYYLAEPVIFQTPRGKNKGGAKYKKSPTLTAKGAWQENNKVVEPVRIGDIGSQSQAHRVYACDGKSITINAGGGAVKEVKQGFTLAQCAFKSRYTEERQTPMEHLTAGTRRGRTARVARSRERIDKTPSPYP